MKPLSSISDTASNSNWEEPKPTNNFSSSVVEHKWHVSKAMENTKQDRTLQQSKSNLCLFPDAEDKNRALSRQALLSTAMGHVEVPYVALKKHPFMDRQQHPFVVAKNGRSMSSSSVSSRNNSHCNKLYNESVLGALGTETMGVVDFDEDLEYYSELECYRKQQNTPISVRMLYILLLEVLGFQKHFVVCVACQGFI